METGVVLRHLIRSMSRQPLELRVVDTATKKGVVKVPPTVKSNISLFSLLFGNTDLSQRSVDPAHVLIPDRGRPIFSPEHEILWFLIGREAYQVMQVLCGLPGYWYLPVGVSFWRFQAISAFPAVVNRYIVLMDFADFKRLALAHSDTRGGR